MNAYLMTTDFGLGQAQNDELIAGARLEWSAMFAIDSSKLSLVEFEGTTFKRLANQLRGLMEAMGLQSVQFKTVTSKVMNSPYRNQIVAEMTTPINRRLKADLRWDLEQLAKQVGLDADTNASHNNLRLMKQGVLAGVTGGAVAQPGTGDNYKPQDQNNNSGWDSFLNGLGISTPFALAGGALLLIILMRR